MASWFKALKKTRNVFKEVLSKVVKGRERLDEETLEELESSLLQADVSPRLAGEIIASLEKHCRGKEVEKTEALKEVLLKQFHNEARFNWRGIDKPHCILIVGINGSGKTTTSAKLGLQAREAGLKPLLGAADTFRAAGTDQVRMWADRLNIPVVAGQQNSDAASVAFDAMDALVARDLDVLIIDTAGRMHTKKPLMDELEKINRALSKRIPAAPHETWIVLDGSNGQNAISQARFFNDVVPLTGIIITKLDGSSKAGFLFSVSQELKVPILFTGVGEQAEDLVPFDAEAFVNALVGTETEETVDAEIA